MTKEEREARNQAALTVLRAKYTGPLAALLTLKRRPTLEDWPDYAALGITASHGPELWELLALPAHLDIRSEPELWALLHTLCSLSELLTLEEWPRFLQVMATMLPNFDISEDVAEACAHRGPAIWPLLPTMLADQALDENVRSFTLQAMFELGQRHPEIRALAIDHLLQWLEQRRLHEIHLNTLALSYLIDFHHYGGGLDIERTMAAARVIHELEAIDLFLNGTIEEVEVSLGLRPAPLEPEYNRQPAPRHDPHSWASTAPKTESVAPKVLTEAERQRQLQTKLKERAKKKAAKKSKKRNR